MRESRFSAIKSRNTINDPEISVILSVDGVNGDGVTDEITEVWEGYPGIPYRRVEMSQWTMMAKKMHPIYVDVMGTVLDNLERAIAEDKLDGSIPVVSVGRSFQACTDISVSSQVPVLCEYPQASATVSDSPLTAARTQSSATCSSSTALTQFHSPRCKMARIRHCVWAIRSCTLLGALRVVDLRSGRRELLKERKTPCGLYHMRIGVNGRRRAGIESSILCDVVCTYAACLPIWTAMSPVPAPAVDRGLA